MLERGPSVQTNSIKIMMSTATSESECAECGKQGGDSLKACTACKLVKYCNVICQKAHHLKHKKECKKRAAALFDEALFKLPPRREDCPICYLELPSMEKTVYQPCCGKVLCKGCMYEMARGKANCAFCRMPATYSDEEFVDRCKNRMEAGDANAFSLLGSLYLDGDWGLPQDPKKALELMLRSIELGSTKAHYRIAWIYDENGEEFMEKDHKKAIFHYQRGAMGGCEVSRHKLGWDEAKRGNIDRAMKHWMIAAATGCEDSLVNIRKGFMCKHATKLQYEEALRAYQ
ncbi:hypothetical protein ACHAXR_003511, partial [Thalassiosira sp. AJA248-18]